MPGRVFVRLRTCLLAFLVLTIAVSLKPPQSAHATIEFGGLYAVTTASGGKHWRLAPGSSTWEQEAGAATSLAGNLKTRGALMVYKEKATGGGGGYTFRVSTDGGETWTQTAKPSDDTSFGPVDADLCSDGRLWLAWQKNDDARTRIYYSDDYGVTINLVFDQAFGSQNAAHQNGSLSCHASDPGRVAVTVQRGLGARLIYTLNGGGTWNWSAFGATANGFRAVWSDSRLVVIYDHYGSFNIWTTDNNGASWTQRYLQSGPSGSSSNIDVIRTEVPGLLFAYYQETGGSFLGRSIDNGATWQPVGALPPLGVGSLNGIAYSATNDNFYVSWGYQGKAAVLPQGGTRDWAAVTQSDWVALPQIGEETGTRALAVLSFNSEVHDAFALPSDQFTKDPVSIYSGDFTHQHTDLLIPGKGIPLEFTRYYHSGSSVSRSLGVGWTHSYDFYLTFDGSDVNAFYPDGHAVRFNASGSNYIPRPGVYETLVKNGDNSYTLTMVSALRYNFSSAGKLTSIVDRNGNATSLAYDSNGFLDTVTDAGGRIFNFTVNATGRITGIEDPLGRTVSFEYDAEGDDLITVTDVKGGVTEYAYSNHRLTSLTDSNDHVMVANVYDSAGRVVEQRDALGNVTCLYFGQPPAYASAACPGVNPAPAATQTVVVDARGKKTTYTFNSLGQTIKVADHDGGEASYGYDFAHNRTCVTDPLGHKTGYTYDAKGNVTGVIDAENTDASCALKAGGVKWTYSYTVLNDIDLETDPLGRQTDYVYDANGNLIEVIRKDSGGSVKLRTCFTVPTSGQNKGLVTEVIESATLTDCTGNKTKFEYDQYGNQTAVIDPRFSSQGTPPKTTMTYDLGGRRLTVTNELGHTTTFTYDNQNNVLTVQDHIGNKTVNTYDPKGNLKTITDANRKTVGSAEAGSACGGAETGNGIDDDGDTVIDDGCPSTIYNYDDYDRLVGVIDALGKTTVYRYDAVGNRNSVTNANRQAVGSPETGSACGASGTGNGVDNDGDGAVDDGCPSVLYAYDNLNRLASQKDALGNTWTYGYDAASRLTSRTDPKSQQTTYAYNLRNDLTSIDYPPGTPDVTFQYDALRNRTQMTDGTGTTIYVYDALNRLTSVTFPGSRTVSYGYSNVGNRTSITYPGGTNQVTYAYDEANNLISVTDWNGNQTNYTYDNAGMLATVTLPSSTGVVGTYTYDNADRLTGIAWVKNGSTTLASVSYTLDPAGNRTQRVDQAGTHLYTYDALHRLTGADYPGPDNHLYTYDAVGNRLTKTGVSGGYTYDAADRMLAAGGVAYAYDDNGNLTSRGADTFTWDAEDRLTSATVSGATTAFAYNGDGLRHSRTFAGNTTTFTWEVARSIPQVLDDETFRYVYGLGRIAQVSGTATHYYLPDGLGSTMALIDAAGTVVNAYDYDVFGALRGSTGTQPNEFAFAGEQVDAATGLQYLRARYYDMETGRFLSRDPLSGVWAEPGSLNRYPFVLNDPVNLVDPLGLHCAPLAHPHHCVAEKVMDVVDWGKTVANHPVSVVQQTMGTAVALTSSGERSRIDDVTFYENCWGSCWFLKLIPATEITFGHVVFSEQKMSPSRRLHELAHVRQGDDYGLAWIPVYVWEQITRGYACNKFEEEARREAEERVQCPGKE